MAGAHEAIRPTDLAYTPERVAAHLPAEQLKLYTLIYQRFVACQMNPAIFAVTNVEVSADKGIFKAQGSAHEFDGYRKVLIPAGKQEDLLLPALHETDPLNLLKLKPTQHFTEPPPRYNEASLVKTLEKEGIGRPSTYASIIGKIQDRGYVEERERRFYATETGMKVTDLLVLHFPKVMDLKFTRRMEEELDQIETKKLERRTTSCRSSTIRSGCRCSKPRRRCSPTLKSALSAASLSTAPQQVRQIFRLYRLSGLQVHQEKGRGRAGANREARPNRRQMSHVWQGDAAAHRQAWPFSRLQRLSRLQDDHGLRRRGQTRCDQPGHGVYLLEVSESDGSRAGPRGPFLGCSGYPSARTLSMSMRKASRSYLWTPASNATSAAVR